MTEESHIRQLRWVIALLLAIAMLAILFNRPVKVSILENVYVEVGGGEAGPPEFYEKALELEDGRIIYLSDGGCKVRP